MISVYNQLTKAFPELILVRGESSIKYVLDMFTLLVAKCLQRNFSNCSFWNEREWNFRTFTIYSAVLFSSSSANFVNNPNTRPLVVFKLKYSVSPGLSTQCVDDLLKFILQALLYEPSVEKKSALFNRLY